MTKHLSKNPFKLNIPNDKIHHNFDTSHGKNWSEFTKFKEDETKLLLARLQILENRLENSWISDRNDLITELVKLYKEALSKEHINQTYFFDQIEKVHTKVSSIVEKFGDKNKKPDIESGLSKILDINELQYNLKQIKNYKNIKNKNKYTQQAMMELSILFNKYQYYKLRTNDTNLTLENETLNPEFYLKGVASDINALEKLTQTTLDDETNLWLLKYAAKHSKYSQHNINALTVNDIEMSPDLIAAAKSEKIEKLFWNSTSNLKIATFLCGLNNDSNIDPETAIKITSMQSRLLNIDITQEFRNLNIL